MSAEVGSRPLRIGIATDSLQERVVDGEVRIANGGIGVYIQQLVSHLLAIDERNEYFLMRVGEGRLDIYRSPRAKCVFLPKTLFNRAGALLGTAYERPAREFQLDVMHFPNMFGAGMQRVSTRQIATIHDLTPLIMPATHPLSRVIGYRMLTGRVLRGSDRILVPSRATGRDLVDRLVPAERIVRVPLGINPSMRRVPATSEFAARYLIGGPFLLNVGVLEPRKNHTILIDVLRELRRDGHDLELTIIGRPGWRWANPLNSEKYRDMKPWVRILVDVPDSDLIEFYNRAEIFIYPSFYEGFGLPILEAMACGAPVIASSVSSMPEVTGEAALLADPYDARSFTTQALRLLREPGLRQAMVDAGIERAGTFSWQLTAEGTLAVYEELCRSF